MVMVISKLLIYPIKSIGGIHLEKAVCREEGFEHDRRMMLVDKEGNFISQRAFPKLSLLRPELRPDGFKVFNFKNLSSSIDIPWHFEPEKAKEVRVWNHTLMAGVAPKIY